MNHIQILIIRDGHRYFYSRIINGRPEINAQAITAARAEQICTANDDEEKICTGQQNFGRLPCHWSVTYRFTA